MSGIVGIFDAGGGPVDRPLLDRLTATLAFRGPDAQQSWADGPVGFGHALLRTTDESAGESQPLTLDGKVWIVADARVDGRADLIRDLSPHTDGRLGGVPDVELILRAYHAWGDGCLDRLLGDFAFAIWDGRRRRLLCARDHFGIRPFVYARRADTLAFGNTLETVRAFPGVSARPDERAVGDFLLFGWNRDPARTAFADVARLPPGHALAWAVGDAAPVVRRYWSLPVDEPMRLRDPAEYPARFREVFAAAVTDRMRTSRVAVSMSGGLDSSSIAAVAARHATGGGRACELKAVTTVADRLVPHEERRYAGLVAEQLGLPIDYMSADEYRLFERWDERGVRSPEPTVEPFAAVAADLLGRAAEWGRVVLTGQGGDPCFYGPQEPWRGRSAVRAAADVARFAVRYRMVPTLGLRAAAGRLAGRRRLDGDRGGRPAWLDAEFVRRLGLDERWRESNRPGPSHPSHPEAYAALTDPMWSGYLEMYDAGRTRLPLEARHPFFDLRVIRFVLAVPPVPWCMSKGLVRAATVGLLPEPVRRRKKAPLLVSPVRPRFAETVTLWDELAGVDRLVGRYVDIGAVALAMRTADRQGTFAMYRDLRPMCLLFWLQAVARGLQ